MAQMVENIRFCYLNLINLESDNMGLLLVPYIFNSEYSIEEINNRQHLIAEPVVQSSSILIHRNGIVRRCQHQV
jgi:hypothetical protein